MRCLLKDGPFAGTVVEIPAGDRVPGDEAFDVCFEQSPRLRPAPERVVEPRVICRYRLAVSTAGRPLLVNGQAFACFEGGRS